MSILVTGGAGFIGSNFLHHLVSITNEEIVCIDKLTYAADWQIDGEPIVSDKDALGKTFKQCEKYG